MTDIQYASQELIKRLDDLAIDDTLRLQLMFYIHQSFESEEILNENCEVLNRHVLTKKKEFHGHYYPTNRPDNRGY